MYRFLETYNLLKLHHEVMKNLNRPMTRTEIESIIKPFPSKKNPGLDGFTPIKNHGKQPYIKPIIT